MPSIYLSRPLQNKIGFFSTVIQLYFNCNSTKAAINYSCISIFNWCPNVPSYITVVIQLLTMARVVRQSQFGTWKYRWLKSSRILFCYEIHGIRDDVIECFATTFLHTHSWLNWVVELNFIFLWNTRNSRWCYWMFCDHFSAHSLLAKLGRGIRDENLCYFDGLLIDSLHMH